MTRRRCMLDYAAVGIVVLAVVVLFWPFGSGDDDDAAGADDSFEVATSTPEPASAVASPTAASTPTSVADLTPRPESSPAPAPTPDEPHPCDVVDTEEIFIAFVERFNEGNFDALRQLLPPESHAFAPSLTSVWNQPAKFHAFMDRGDWMGDIQEIIEFLRAQHERGERWRIEDVEALDLRPNQYLRDLGLGEVTATLIRSRAGFELDELWGHATVNCTDQTITVWRFLLEDSIRATTVPVDDFLAGMALLEPGQMRSTLMEVDTDIRVDGGLLYRWRVQHDQAFAADGTPLQRIFIRNETDRDVSMLLIGPEGWYLNHRGWEAAGEGPLSVLPLEYELALDQPELTADLIQEHLADIPEGGELLMTRSVGEIPDALRFTRQYLQGEIQSGEFIVRVASSLLFQARFRVFDETNQPTQTPELWFFGVRIFDDFDLDGFAVVPGPEIGDRQYETTDPIADDLNFVGPLGEGLGEVYEFGRFGLEFRVEVTPSRGGLYPSARGENWVPTWDLHSMTVDDRWLRWADSRGAGHPTRAIWDTGRYRFSLAVQADPLPPDVVWDEDRLLHIVRALSRD